MANWRGSGSKHEYAIVNRAHMSIHEIERMRWSLLGQEFVLEEQEEVVCRELFKLANHDRAFLEVLATVDGRTLKIQFMSGNAGVPSVTEISDAQLAAQGLDGFAILGTDPKVDNLATQFMANRAEQDEVRMATGSLEEELATRLRCIRDAFVDQSTRDRNRRANTTFLINGRLYPLGTGWHQINDTIVDLDTNRALSRFTEERYEQHQYEDGSEDGSRDCS